MSFKITAVMYINSEKSLESAIENMLEASGLNTAQIKPIVIDSLCTQETREICEKYFDSDAVVLSQKDIGISAAYNAALPYIEGDYVHFTLSSSSFSQGTYKKAIAVAEKNSAPAVNIEAVTYDNEGKEKIYGKSIAKSGFVSLRNSYTCCPLLIGSYIFSTSLLENKAFDVSIYDESTIKLVLEILKELDFKIFRLKGPRYYSTLALENDASLSYIQYDKRWYTQSVRSFLIPFITDNMCVPCLDATVYYLLMAKYNCNYFANNKYILTREETDCLFDASCELLSYIDNCVFEQSSINGINLPRSLRILMIAGKLTYQSGVCSKESHISSYLRENHGKFKEYNKLLPFESNRPERLCIQAINYDDGRLIIDAAFENSVYFKEDKLDISGEFLSGNGRITVEKGTVYPLLKCFGISYARKYPVRITVPIDESADTQSFAVYDNSFNADCVCKGMAFVSGKPVESIKTELGGFKPDNRIYFDFMLIASRLNGEIKSDYWVFKRGMTLTYCNGVFTVQKMRKLGKFTHEIKFLASLTKRIFKQSTVIKSLALRTLYWVMRPVYGRKRIWITCDKLYKGGDNGEYFYKYCLSKKDGVNCYYIVNRSSADYERLKRQGKNILAADSAKCRILSLYAEKVFATHSNIITYCGFPRYAQPYFRSLFKADVVCIQHGLTVQKIAEYQNRLFDNTKLYCCASPYEVANLEHPYYDYDSSALKLTGLARFDGLKSDPKRQILITPTWRRNVVNASIARIKKSYNENFKNTDYFKIYNALINDQRLIDCAKANNYKLIYLLHPAISAQIDDFDKNVNVEIIQASGSLNYEKILTQSDLMVTDYSGVQFDFAYQRKPIIYYHPDAIPPHYASSGLEYDKMGFGPICKTHEQIINTLCEYIENGCKISDEYIERANKFFAYSDFNNCERIYNECIK